MILLQSYRACRFCPVSLICIGEHWSTRVSQQISLRRCRRCRRVFFTVGNQQYICARFTVVPGQVFGTTEGGCVHSFKTDCIEHHDDDFTARY
jgi:hypothetical protein